MARARQRVPAPPERLGHHEGLAYALFMPAGEPAGGVVILHGAGSRKESHFDFARVLRGQGMAAISFDQRGHGDSEGELDGRALEDVAAICELLPPGPRALRGSSMGGYLAIVGAEHVRAEAVVAICPASGDHLRRGIRSGRFDVRIDVPAFERLLAEHDVRAAVERLPGALLLMHAEGDEQIPIEHTRELHEAARSPGKRLLEVRGGHHRSIQHDPELQSHAARFIERALRGARDAG